MKEKGLGPWFPGLYIPLLVCICSALSLAQPLVLDDLTGPWQLFVDEYLIEEKSGVVRTYHSLEKHPGNPVLDIVESWGERWTTPYGTVLADEDGQGYRIWYDIWDGDCHNFYATSEDGLNWVRPNLGLVEHRGSKENNLFFHRTRLDHMPQVIHTPWEADPEKRYKMINFDFGARPHERSDRGYWGATSPDGVHWTETPRNPILPDPGDVGHFLWDPHRQRYLGYPKTFAQVRGSRRRSVGISATTQFERWPPTELILAPDEFDDRWVRKEGQRTDFYGLSVFPYQNMYLGFLWVFRITDGKNDGPIFCELVSSRDGAKWDRQEGDRTPILPLGPAGAWDGGQLQTFNLPLLVGDRLRVYYGAFNRTHGFQKGDGAIGLATIRKDGFVSLDAESELGVVTTRLLKNLKGELRLNANASEGEIRVEVLDHDGRVLPGYGRGDCQAMTEDEVDRLVKWKTQEELPTRGGPHRLRFFLTRSSLFSFRAGDRVQVLSRAEEN